MNELIARNVIQASGLLFLLAAAAAAGQQVEPQSPRTGSGGGGWGDVLIATLATDGSFSTASIRQTNQSAPNYYTVSSDGGAGGDAEVRAKSSASDSATNETSNSPDGPAAQADRVDDRGGSGDDLNLDVASSAQDRLNAVTSLLNAAASDSLADGSLELAPRSGQPKSGFASLDTGKSPPD